MKRTSRNAVPLTIIGQRVICRRGKEFGVFIGATNSDGTASSKWSRAWSRGGVAVRPITRCEARRALGQMLRIGFGGIAADLIKICGANVEQIRGQWSIR